MPKGKVVCQVSLKHLKSKQEFKGEVIVDGAPKVFNLPPGDYERTFTLPEDYQFIGKNPEILVNTNGLISISVTSVNGKGKISSDSNSSEPEKPPSKAILSAAIGLTLLSNLGQQNPFFKRSLDSRLLQ
jgi:hypothetical protein